MLFGTIPRRAIQSMFEWSASCFSSISADSNFSVHVTVSGWKYLFNCSEGTSRIMYQRGQGWKRYKAIFLTGIGAERSSGLPGLLLGMGQSGVTKLDIFGPSGLDHYLASTRNSVIKPSLGILTHEITENVGGPTYQDERLSVFAIPILPDGHAKENDRESLKRKRESSDLSLPARKKAKQENFPLRSPSPTQTQQNDIKGRHVSPLALMGEDAAQWRRQIIYSMFPGDGSSTSDVDSAEAWWQRKSDIMNMPIPQYFHQPYAMVYILLGAKVRGKFDVIRAEALKLEKPWMRGKLANGIPVTLSNGNVITPDMVLGPSPPQDAMMIVDCPSIDYISSLTQSASFSNYKIDGKFSFHCIFHLLGPGVLEDSRYKAWLESFGEDVHHLVAGPDITLDEISLASTAHVQLRLSQLDASLFQVPKTISNQSNSGTLELPKCMLLRHNHYVSLKPAISPTLRSPDDDVFRTARTSEGVQALLKPKTIEIFQKVRQMIHQEACTKDVDPWKGVSITALGTGSAVPSKYRNVSSLLLQWPNSGSILLDCGEGTFGQIYRQFGDNANDIMRRLRCIFISHLHADHHLGLSKLLYHRRRLNPACNSPLTLIAQPIVQRYLLEHSYIEDLGLSDPMNGVQFLPCEDIRHNHPISQHNSSIYLDLLSSLDLASLSTVRVKHRGLCHGIVIRHQDGGGVVYSGDTMPCDELIDAGLNATLLIHEATMGDDEEELALKKRHSTISQAIGVAKRMQAKNVLLTHFSGRYPKAIQMAAGYSADSSLAVGVAFDHLTIGINEMWKLNLCLPAIEQSFLDSDEPDDDTTINA